MWNVLATGAVAVLLALGCYGEGLISYAQPSIPTLDVVAFEQRVKSDTELLTRTTALLSQAAYSYERLRLEKSLLEVANRRAAAMISLMENAPAIALKYALPAELRNQLPSEARSHVEERVTVKGTLEVLCILGEDGRSEIKRYLDLDDARLQVFTEEMPDQYVTGTRVAVDGLRLRDQLVADKQGITLIEPASDSQDVDPEGVSGVRTARALVINVNFRSMPSQPWTMQRAEEIYTTLVTPWFDEASYGHFSFEADIAGWYTIDALPSTCATGTFLNQAVAAATADGYDVARYNHVVIAFPRVPACRWAGLALVGGRYAWLNNAMNRNVSVHELGHNLGLYHSHSQRCSAGPLYGACSTSEYGDRFDTMGSGGQVPYHGTYKAFLGWIPGSDVVSITPEDQESIVTISSVESDSGPRVLRVARPGTNQFFTVEMREAVGLSAPLANYPALSNGVAVYLGPSMRNQSVIIMAYEMPSASGAPLLVGDTLYDPNSTLSITPLAVGDGEATIYVSYIP